MPTQMEWDFIVTLLDPALLIVLVTCWAIGYVLKNTPWLPNWSIIFIVTTISIFFTLWILGPGPLSWLQGILCGIVAVFGYELLKAAKEGAVGR